MQAEGKAHGHHTPGTDNGVSHQRKESSTAIPARYTLFLLTDKMPRQYDFTHDYGGHKP